MGDFDLAVTSRLTIPAREIAELASRASGPGGQHVNKSNTRVTLRWNIRHSPVLLSEQRARLLHRLGPVLTRDGELVVHADGERSRARNLAAARRRLAERVAQALWVERPRRATRPSLASKERHLDRKRRQSKLKRGRGRVREHDDR
jgi:ribosome-associated protein